MNTRRKQLEKKFREAEREEAQKKAEREKQLDKDLSVESYEPEIEIRKPKITSVAEADKLIRTRQKLMDDFKAQRRREVEESENLEKRYKPITAAIEKTSQEIVPIAVPPPTFASSTPRRKMIQFDDYDEPDLDQSSTLPDPTTPEKESYRQNKSIKQALTLKKIILDSISSEFLPRANDNKFGIYYDETAMKFKIGSEKIEFDHDDIIIGAKRYKGTRGLWRLLTVNDYIDKVMYKEDDWENYKHILYQTNSIYQRNDPTTGKPKSSGGRKWMGLVKKIWDEFKNIEEEVSGSGLAEYNENPIEYKYISSLNDLTVRLAYIDAQENAGNNNFHNEKLSVVKFIRDRLVELAKTEEGEIYLRCCFAMLPRRMIQRLGSLTDIFSKFNNDKLGVAKFLGDCLEELIETPKGVKYLNKFITALPKPMIVGAGLLNDLISQLSERTIVGSGLLNDIINNLPFELHWPGTNFTGPGTKLEERLKRGDRGIHPLDEGSREHDIWYRDHPKTEDRWVADKKLQKIAMERLLSEDAELKERIPAAVTAVTMWAKRKFGMGLSTSGYAYRK